jgi:predicted RNase H-like nuclease (RuvC/YqgF family)
MRKIVLVLFMAAFVFANESEINKKLDLLLQKIEQLEKKVNQKDYEIERLKKELQQQQNEIKKQEIQTKNQFAIKSCDKLKVVSLKYSYFGEVIPYYKLTIKIKNTYPKEVTFIKGTLYAEDKDRVKILEDFIDRKIDIKPGEVVTIKKKHIINNDLEEYLKDENPKNLKIYFAPTRVEFKDGSKIECFN